MPRATNGPASRRRKNRLFKQTKGYWGGRKNLLRTARETHDRAMAFAFRDRRVRKRTMRQLWITRIGIAAKLNGMNYNSFMHGLGKANVALNRKMLAAIAVADEQAFAHLIKLSRKAAAA
jgi:large subunit ribosomal protein L20